MIHSLVRKTLWRQWIVITGLAGVALLVAIGIRRYAIHPVRAGQYILVTSNQYRWPEDHIFAMLPDGSRLTRLARGFDPSCSPDGRRIAFAAPVGALQPDGRNPYTQLFVMNADGSNVKQLTFDDSYYNRPVWSPDGKYLAYKSKRNIAIMDLDNLNETYLLGQEWEANYPVWSPDGKRLVFYSSAEEGRHAINIDGSNLIRLTNGFDYEPDWSPDGQYIVFLHGLSAPTLRVIRADGNDPVDILLGDYSPSSPKWSPDGKQIIFVQEHDGVFVINADGSGLTPLIEAGQEVWAAEGGFIPMRRYVFFGGVDWCEVR